MSVLSLIVNAKGLVLCMSLHSLNNYMVYFVHKCIWWHQGSSLWTILILRSMVMESCVPPKQSLTFFHFKIRLQQIFNSFGYLLRFCIQIAKIIIWYYFNLCLIQCTIGSDLVYLYLLDLSYNL